MTSTERTQFGHVADKKSYDDEVVQVNVSSDDDSDMYRLGNKQELKRRFNTFALSAYVILLALTWESVVINEVFAVPNGGTAGSIYIIIGCSTGMGFVMLSLAEMASMSPTAAGQYHWVSEFSPPSLQKPLSYFVGWLTALGWQVGMPAVCYTLGLQTMAAIQLYHPGFTIHGWYGCLFTIAYAVVAIAFNLFALPALPTLQGAAAMLHVAGFIAFIALLWAKGPGADAHTVFTTFTDSYGWGGGGGLASLVSLVGPVTALIGADAAVHLAEELHDASRSLPRAMCAGAAINYVSAIAMTITLAFNIGDLDSPYITDAPAGQPWTGIVRDVTQSRAAVLIFIVLLTVMFLVGAVNQVTTSSRQLWAFARDGGVPLHRLLAKVHEPDGVPRYSILATFLFNSLVSLIIIGSDTAFGNILALCDVAVYSSYLVSISSLLSARFTRPYASLPRRHFSLGPILGPIINIIAICFLLVVLVFLFFPSAPNPTPKSMNWAICIWGGVILLGVVDYVVRGRKEYEGPVVRIRRARAELAS